MGLVLHTFEIFIFKNLIVKDIVGLKDINDTLRTTNLVYHKFSRTFD